MKSLLAYIPILVLTLFTISSARDTVTPTRPLADNETLVSAGAEFALGFFTPPNSSNRYLGLWYNKITKQTIVWVANRENPIVSSTGLLSIAPRGVLTITDASSAVVWSANATGLDSAVAQLLDTGNFVVKEDKDDSGAYAWQGFDHPTDTMLPGMRIGVDRTRGLNSRTTSWKSDNDPSLGSYYAVMDPRGDPEIYVYSGTQKIWRSGAWNGLRLSGSPEFTTTLFSFSFVSTATEATFAYEISNKSILSMLVLNSLGVVQRPVWLWETNQWTVFWQAPKDPCDRYGVCGPYGACDPNISPQCKCLVPAPAFVPKNPSNWLLGDGKDGCVRRTGLDCKNGTDRFVTVHDVKLPETASSVVDGNMNLDECQAKCLMNCSCTAYASANISGGGSGTGCIVWFSDLVDIRLFVGLGLTKQDLFVRVAAADIDTDIEVATPEKSRKRKSAILAAVVSIVSVSLLLACVGCFIWRRKKNRKVILGVTASLNDNSNDLELPLYEFAGIAASTDQFSEENKLGEGGFGPVYKAKIEGNQEIAVKRLAKTSIQGIQEFKNEVVLIAKLQHRNLVRLLGCCVEGKERMLIYEYMPNKSLDFFLFEKGKGALLDWQTRYQIIIGIARGLLYLHQDSRFRIIHRDMKASNILLDKDMNPKISDFGMARIFGGDETDFNTRKIVGTYGYMSPEYAMDGVFSVKSDVFSFGVLVLEIVSGKKNRGVYSHSHHINLCSHAWSLWKEGKSMQLVDESIGYSYPMDEVLRCIKLGLLCVQESPEDRPLMSTVILMLSSDIASLPQPKEPGFVARRGPSESDSPSSKQHCSGATDITATILEGR